MKKIITTLLTLISTPSFAIQWAQPEVLCPEEMIPASIPCLDLKEVADPWKDFPADFSQEQKDEWALKNKAKLRICRAEEVLRREKASPGTQSAIEAAWMYATSANKIDQKIKTINTQASRVGMPAQILYGAIFQESLLADLGISEDGGNYSCGIAQLNLTEWCQTVSTNDPSWPKEIGCGDANASIIAPFYELAKRKLGSTPEYKLNSTHFSGIKYEQVASQLPGADETRKKLFYQAATHFIQKCEGIQQSVEAKANALKTVFNAYVPEALKKRELYRSGENFKRSCAVSNKTYFPLHTGWLMAVGMYNAGPKIASIVTHYNRMKASDLSNPTVWKDFTPLSLIESLYWGGKYLSSNGKINFKSVNGTALTSNWFKSCVVQRHVARVIQHITIPGQKIADSFEVTEGPCSKTSIPVKRQNSSGVKARAVTPSNPKKGQ